ncbi:MAG: hypothetical protein RM338_07000 [Nostoc sp. DedQUE12a]|nr:hypothetical protein [Nostoc sp. DedQUE12a]
MLSPSAAPSKNEDALAFGKHTLHLNYELRITNYELLRDWCDLNARPSASDLCEFPHSLDYTFTIG